MASGATSDVWLARDVARGEDIALKIARDEDAAAILAAEADRLTCAFSSQLPELIDAGRTPEGASPSIAAARPYLAMTWIDGQPLDPRAAYSAEERRRFALVVARDVGEAVARLDSGGVAHGDLKPANILVCGDGQPSGLSAALVDLGLSAPASDALPSGGTPRYFPPELLAHGGGGDARARDRFALGLVLAELVANELAHAGDLAGAARHTVLPAPFDGWCRALLAPDPGARPRASWLADQARRIAPKNNEVEASHARRALAIKAAYLGSRRAEIAIAARAASAVVRSNGRAGEWLERAIALARAARMLRGLGDEMAEITLEDAEPLARARWLVNLVGVSAARWPVAALVGVSDDDLVERMVELGGIKDERAFTLTDLERAAAPGRTLLLTPAEASTEVELVLALSSDRKWAAIDEIERSSSVSATVRRAAADALRRMGEAGRALALLNGDDAEVCHGLRADVARRAGERELARTEATRAIELDAGDDRAHAVLARLEIDAGNPGEALAVLSRAPRTWATLEAGAIALVASGERSRALPELALAEALSSTEEARGRIAGLVGYVAHLNGDVERAAEALARAGDHAERAEALVEEATYLTSEAAVAVDRGHIERALDAALRASLLWEHLARPAEAARALLARAAAYSTAGAELEAQVASREARERARWLGDERAEAFACWSLTDVLAPGHPDAQSAARFALGVLAARAGDEDHLRAIARLLRHAPAETSVEQIAWGDGIASRETTLPA
ncbi:MAG TPA: hypothetical protein VJT73_10115, partial [Polyangiaceae bacterium]|nr:hypothetical protein [Polyangiaceae bacterium]